jgi:hypothetical protein
MICENDIVGIEIGIPINKYNLAILNIHAMKTNLLISSIMSLVFATSFAQDRTIVNASNSEISDNLDLRAVASIFADSRDLADFEYRLNDPKAQISNLDLNDDNQVDYLRVLESIEGTTHIIILQAILGQDQYQDVATIEVERDNYNRMQVQIVGDPYVYGNNYIYEPIYNSIPIIFNYFGLANYHPYYSQWNWEYYPRYYYKWRPFPILNYRNNIGLHINFNYQYRFANNRRCHAAYQNYYERRGNYYERTFPNRSFGYRNQGFSNRYELNQTRSVRDITYGSNPSSSVYSGTRNYAPNPNITPSDPIQIGGVPIYNNPTPRENSPRTINTGNSTPRVHSGGRR